MSQFLVMYLDNNIDKKPNPLAKDRLQKIKDQIIIKIKFCQAMPMQNIEHIVQDE